MLTGDEPDSKDLHKIGTWGQKEDALDIKFNKALTSDQNRELQLMVQRFSEIFSDRPCETNLAEHRTDLTSDVPVCQMPYLVPFSLQPSLKRVLQQMESQPTMSLPTVSLRVNFLCTLIVESTSCVD